LLTDKALIITIDGPAGSGKSTTARRVAEKLGYAYLDSGALYRAVTLAALEENIDLQDEQQVQRLAGKISIELRAADCGLQVFLGGRDITLDIRLPAVTEAIAPVAANPGVRRALLASQRRFAQTGGVVAEGRDMGTVVFPDADLKFFMVASIEERARRRQSELAGKGINLSLSEIMSMIEQRDQNDSRREHSPLRKPEQAMEINTSCLSIDEQVDLVIREVYKKQYR
jgi:CMP/dCMP kinase